MKSYFGMSLILIALACISCNRVFVTEKPVDVVIERPKPPNPNFVWIGPGYIKKGGKQVYRPGYWISPPNSRHRWIDGRWKAKRGGWVWIPGHWN